MKLRKTRSVVMFTVILSTLFAVTAFTPVTASAAAKKKVYVISDITIRDTSGRTVDHMKYSYNKNGLVTKRVWSQPGGSVSDSYQYDKSFHIKKQTTGEGGKKGSECKYIYKNGLLTECKDNYIAMGEKVTTFYEYNNKGQLKKMEGDNTPETTFKYNRKGLLKQKSELYNYEGAKPEKTTYKYDKKGNVKKIYQGKTLDRIYKNSYVKGTRRLKSVTVCYGNGRTICTCNISYKTMKVSRAAAQAVSKQQVQWTRDPVFTLFQM